jgi:S-adenosylmethionine hydrolase
VSGKIDGTVVAYSEAGSLITDIPHDRLSGVPRDSSVTVTCDEHETVGIFSADHKEPDFTLLAVLGPSGFLELHIVGDSAKIMLGVRLGERIVVKW